MKNTIRSLFLTSFIIVLVSACTAKRAEIFTQGQGTNLDTVDAWKEKMIPITTGDEYGTTAYSSFHSCEGLVAVKDYSDS